MQTEERWLQVWCYSYRGAITSDMFADPVPLSDMPACTVQQAMHSGIIYSDTRVCKVLLHQARYLVCYKSSRHAYRLGAAPAGLLNLSATILDAILNISNSQ